MLKLLNKLKLFTNSTSNVKLNNGFIHVQNVGIVNVNNNIELIIIDGPLKGHLLEDKSGILELGSYIDIKDIILELDLNKIYKMIDLLESLKSLELTNEQLMGLSRLLPKSY